MNRSDTSGIMQTYPHRDGARLVSFSIDSVYASPRQIGRLLESVPGVEDVRVRRPFGEWKDVHMWFSYRDHPCTVVEPYGDNSQSWIGPEQDDGGFDCGPIEQAFRAFQPTVWRRILGGFVTLSVLKRD